MPGTRRAIFTRAGGKKKRPPAAALGGVVLGLLGPIVAAAAAPGGETHTWTDASGQFHVEAEFLDGAYSKEKAATVIRLRKADGQIIEVPIGRLGESSKQLARRLMRQQKAATSSAKPTSQPAKPDAPPPEGPKRPRPGPQTLRSLLGERPIMVKTEPIAQGIVMDVAAGDRGELFLLVQGHSPRTDAVVAVDSATGKLAPPVAIPKAGSAAGLCWYDGSLWVLGRSANAFLRRLGPAGQVVATAPLRTSVPGSYYGLAMAEGRVFFVAQSETGSTICAFSPADGQVAPLFTSPGKIRGIAVHDGRLFAHLADQFDTYADDWLLTFDLRGAVSRDPKPRPATRDTADARDAKPDANPAGVMRKLQYPREQVWGLATAGENLGAVARRDTAAEIYTVVARPEENLVAVRPLARRIEVRLPITNETPFPYEMDVYLACPIDRPFQQVANLTMRPAPVRDQPDVYGNRWVQFHVQGAAEPGEIALAFDLLTVQAARTIDPAYVARPEDFPPEVLRAATCETHCFDYSHPAVAAADQRIPVAAGRPYLEQILTLRNGVNDALEIVGASGPESRASDFLSQGVGRCYAHTLSFAALARRRGFPVRAIGGLNLGDGSCHTWNQIYVPGVGWTDLDATNDDDKGGKHTYRYVGYHRDRTVITFVGDYARADRRTTFAQRSWWTSTSIKSLDPRRPAKVKLGQAEVKVTPIEGWGARD